MKNLLSILLIFILVSCSSTQLVNNWKNPDIDIFEPTKILIIGMTSNKSARKKFEKQFKEEYLSRGIEATTSLEMFGKSFTKDKKSEAALKEMENKLINDGFNSILFTKVIGVEDKIIFSEKYDDFENTHRQFRDDYYDNQDIYYNRNYYQKYKVYHAETSLYCICSGKDRELIWKGYIDIIDPGSVKATIDDYINLVLFVLEEQQLINKKVEDVDNIEI
jgi:hypothetical protein